MAEGSADKVSESNASAPPWLNPQNALVIAFGILVVSVILVCGAALFVRAPETDPFLVTRTVAVLFAAAALCAVLICVQHSDMRSFGNGLSSLLSVQRASLAAFILAGVATIGVCLFVAVTALYSGRVQHGLYVLAAIQFLLKFAAVSAIIVLITLRKPNAQRPAQSTAGGLSNAQAGTSTHIDSENGTLEFGGIAFAFGLVVIAGLVIPNEELMRLSAMFFGNQKKVEDYLPHQSLITAGDEVGEMIISTFNQDPSIQTILRKLEISDQSILNDTLRISIKSATYAATIDNARRIGALPMLEGICDGTHEDVVFANATNRVLSDHLSYLVSQGLIYIPYQNMTNMMVTEYGNAVMYKKNNEHCLGHEVTSQDVQVIDTLRLNSQIEVQLSATPKTYALDLPPGRYYVAAVATDGSDPVIRLVGREGRLVAEDDDSGPGRFDAMLYFDVEQEDAGLRVSLITFDSQPGNVIISVKDASNPPPPAANSSFTSLPDVPTGSSVPQSAAPPQQDQPG